MSYHDLSTCTLTAEERAEEAERLLTIITTDGSLGNLTDMEIEFLTQIVHMNYGVSVKQLFWLRDLKDKVI
jgi:hypothetical protein